MMILSEQMKAGGLPSFKPLSPRDDGYPEGHTAFAVELEAEGNYSLMGEQAENKLKKKETNLLAVQQISDQT